jgi:hypothetical protein
VIEVSRNRCHNEVLLHPSAPRPIRALLVTQHARQMRGAFEAAS